MYVCTPATLWSQTLTLEGFMMPIVVHFKFSWSARGWQPPERIATSQSSYRSRWMNTVSGSNKGVWRPFGSRNFARRMVLILDETQCGSFLCLLFSVVVAEHIISVFSLLTEGLVSYGLFSLAPMLDALACGVHECRSKPVAGERLELDKFLDNMLRSRISRRVIAEHHINLHTRRCSCSFPYNPNRDIALCCVDLQLLSSHILSCTMQFWVYILFMLRSLFAWIQTWFYWLCPNVHKPSFSSSACIQQRKTHLLRNLWAESNTTNNRKHGIDNSIHSCPYWLHSVWASQEFHEV